MKKKKSSVTKKELRVKSSRKFEEYLNEELQDARLALLYLNEALNDPDKKVFLLALKDVLAAQGGDMTNLAHEAQLNRQNLYRILSKKGNPRWDTINSLFNALGFQVQLSFRK